MEYRQSPATDRRPLRWLPNGFAQVSKRRSAATGDSPQVAVAAFRRLVQRRCAGLVLSPVLVSILWIAAASAVDHGPTGKLRFDPADLDANGLLGPANGKRALDYEFCIPVGDGVAAEVAAIDPSARFYPASRGRIGCTTGEVLVIGNTHQLNFAIVLQRLAALPTVERIDQAFFE